MRYYKSIFKYFIYIITTLSACFKCNILIIYYIINKYFDYKIVIN